MEIWIFKFSSYICITENKGPGKSGFGIRESEGRATLLKGK